MKMVKQRHVVNLLEVLTAARTPPIAAPARPLTHTRRHLHTSAMALLFSVGGKLATWARQVLASRTKIFIVLELVTGGELFDRIVSASRFGKMRPFAGFSRGDSHSAVRVPLGRLRPPITRFVRLPPSQMSRRRASTSASSSLGLSTATARACATAISSRRTCCSMSRRGPTQHFYRQVKRVLTLSKLSRRCSRSRTSDSPPCTARITTRRCCTRRAARRTTSRRRCEATRSYFSKHLVEPGGASNYVAPEASYFPKALPYSGKRAFVTLRTDMHHPRRCSPTRATTASWLTCGHAA